MIRRLCLWYLARGADYGLSRGDTVVRKRWSLGGTYVVADVNWALRAVAIQRHPNGSVQVLPIGAVQKV